jgi:anti-sigma B factor antagonist
VEEPLQLDLDVSRRGDWVVLSVRGDLDLATAPALRQQVAALVADGHRRVALDLAALDFIDSTGLGMVVACLKRVRTADGELFVASDEARIRRVFELTGLVEAVGLVSSVDERVGDA